MDPIISVSWLKEKYRSSGIKIIDCRWNLFLKNYGYNAYLKGHIPGAVFLNMEKDLTDLSVPDMGRHPFPSKGKLERKLEDLGISSKDTIVAYDDDASGSARLWFLLNYYSFDNVLLLDGGFSAWIKSGGLVTREVPNYPKEKFVLGSERKEMIVDDRLLGSNLNDYFLVDVRAEERYSGKTEPIDAYAGHIPTAHNVFWKDVLNSDNRYKSPDEVRKLFQNDGKVPVVYCGSGVTSCVSYIALLRAGIESKLYPGGWSQWSSLHSKENTV